MKRPAGITILCLAMAWLAIAGAGISLIILTDQSSGIPKYLGVFAALYSVTAMAACAGLWRLREWGLYSLRAWMVVALAMAVAMLPTYGDFMLGGILGFLLFVAAVGGLFWVLNNYVKARVQTVA